MSIKTVRYSPGKGARTVAIMPTRKPPALVRSTPKKYTPQYKLSEPMRKQVKKICRSTEETNQKVRSAYGTEGINYENHDFPGIPSNQTDIMRLIPSIAQGDKRDERDGAKIRMTSLSGSFFCHIPAAFNPANEAEASAAAGLSCRLLILSCKQVQALGQFEQNWSAGQNFARQFLKKGSQPTGFLGDLWSLRWPVNTQLFTKHYDRYFTLTRGKVEGDVNVVPEVFKNIKFRIKCKNKLLQFNDPSNTEHTNWSLFAILLYAPNDSSTSSSSPGPVKGNLFTTLNWKEQ